MGQPTTASTAEIGGTDAEVFPNPANEQLTIKTSGTATISVYDATGQLLLQRAVQGTESMPVQHLASGIYQIVIEQNGYKTYRKLMIAH
jgi:hypothetical protein